MRRFLFLISLLFSINAVSEDIVYQIKASYLYNFLQFVQLVEQPDRSESYLNVCIIGENRFGASISVLDGETTPQGVIRMISMTHYNKKKTVEQCQVVYIVGMKKSLAVRVLNDVDNTKVLTIGEFPSFTELGGFIELYIENDSVRFRINSELAGNTQFRVAAQLLSLGVEGS
ncbi:YfiR family protein [Litoribrevibacter albus]|uniref:DUF4154 domain-containing protein n=1 Tax=Litoribrevibacter albus TaxID=1473156 RepID=A0AA37S773_9GAMM|nr:YfiR family protein [Litoribrevibacter albus]GLQ30427.1 hypothetical protein GCM10007876_09050 [Litoribrevibacter albus]